MKSRCLFSHQVIGSYHTWYDVRYGIEMSVSHDVSGYESSVGEVT
jgi:hypothetical protein